MSGLGSESWDSLAREAASPVEVEAIAERELLCFEIEGEPYAVPVDAVREIVRLGPVTPIPRVDPAVRGVVSLRGELLQLIDLRQRLGLSRAELSSRSRILVVGATDGVGAGLLVDAVSEVVRVPEAAIEAPAGGEAGLVSGLCERDGRFLSLLDLSRALDFDAAR